MDILTPVGERRFNPMLDADIFGDVEPSIIRKPDQNKFRFKKPVAKKSPTTPQVNVGKNLKPLSKSNSTRDNLFDGKLSVGNIVNHQRFGKGEVVKLEGNGADVKAEIKFANGDVKKLLLRFAKLEILG